MGKFTHFQWAILACLWLFGCTLDRSGTREPVWTDAGDDSSVMDSGEPPDAEPTIDSAMLDSGMPDAMMSDGGEDASLLDSGSDASISDSGFDSGTDAGRPDSGFDSGVTDAGPPRILTFEFERTLAGGPVRSFWVREDSGVWRSMCSGTDITNPAVDVWRCEYDRVLPSRGVIRFYADFSTTGVSPACGTSNCSAVGVHRLFLDGTAVPPIDISEVDTVAPFPPAGMIRVKLYITPP